MITIFEKKHMPRYHIKDGESPQVIDIKETYPNEELVWVCHNGYFYVGNAQGERYFMSMHGAYDNRQDAERKMEYLNNIRQENFLKDFLD